MLKRVTVFLALFCAVAATGLAQKRVVISTLPTQTKGDFLAPRPLPPGMQLELPQFVVPVEQPASLVMVPVDTAFSTQADTSDSSFAITDPVTGELLAFTGLYDFPENGAGLGYEIKMPTQLIPPFSGELTIDTLVFFMFKLTAWPDLQGDIYMLPLLAPTNINWNPYNGYRVPLEQFTSVPGFTDVVSISKDSINGALDGQNISAIIVPTPGLKIPAGRAFGFTFIAESPTTDTVRMLGGYEWNQSVRPTGGMYTSTNGNDTLRSMFGNLQWNATATPPLNNKPIRQNFDIRIFGTLDVVTSVRPDPTQNATGLVLGANYPNPASEETHISFSIDRSAPVTLRLTNMLGQTVESTTINDRGPGSYVWDIHTSHLPAGSYIYSMTVGNQTITRTMTIAR